MTSLIHRPRNKAMRSERRTGYAMIAPSLVLLTLFLVIPVVLAFGLSFTCLLYTSDAADE